MKKKLLKLIFVVAVIAIAIMFNTKATFNSNSDIDLASLIAASAGGVEISVAGCKKDPGDECENNGNIIKDCDENRFGNDCIIEVIIK